jgi:Rieske Fe-S protein
VPHLSLEISMSTNGPNDPKPPTQPTAAEGEGTSRREVLDAAISGGALLLGGTALYPIIRFVDGPPISTGGDIEVVAGKKSDVAPGKAMSFRFGNKPALLVRDPGGKLRAFIAICTHLSCVVQFREDFGHIWCACHNGHFDMTGRNVQGPPPRPLVELQIMYRDDDVIVRKV